MSIEIDSDTLVQMAEMIEDGAGVDALVAAFPLAPRHQIEALVDGWEG